MVKRSVNFMGNTVKSYKVRGNYSEWVARSAYSWAFAKKGGSLSLEMGDGFIELVSDGDLTDEELGLFSQFLNDYRLRELIDQKTSHRRTEIFKRALNNVYRGEKSDEA